MSVPVDQLNPLSLSVGARFQAHPHVHQLAGRQCDCWAGHLRHDAVRKATDRHLVRWAGMFNGIPPAGRWCPWAAPLPAQQPHHDPSAVGRRLGTGDRHPDPGQ